jgi:glucan endo-1,3-alpha-glucosidase
VEFQEVMASAGHPVYFVPAFQDVPAATDFFSTEFPTLDGAMNWNSWPQNTDGKIVVPTTDDTTYLDGAHAASKTFIMGVSPLQFKHDPTYGNWYRRGEQNLEYRFGQVLKLQPDFVELQTWNDAGESHYMGNSWPEPIDGTNIGAYTTDYPHTAYKEILPAFIKAYKAGATTTDTMYPTNSADAQGAFWHHTLLTTSDCSADSIGEPQGLDTVEDKVTVVVLVASGKTNLSVDISVAGASVGTQALVPGYNQYSVDGLKVGSVSVTVTDDSGATVVSGTGTLPVVATADICNYNFQVVGLA